MKAGPELDEAVNTLFGATAEFYAMIRQEPPSPSRFVSHAWDIVLELRQRGYWVDIQSSGLHPELWKVTVQKAHATDAEPTGKTVEASFSFPEAICLAALRALA